MGLDNRSEQYERVARRLRPMMLLSYTPDLATAAEVEAAEQELGCAFPASFKWFQTEFGAYNGVVTIYGVKPPPAGEWNLVGITLSERQECVPPMPAHLIAFSDNGAGDTYCLDTSRLVEGECPVVFWDHEGDEHQPPQTLAATFLDWLEEEIEKA